MTGNGIAMAGGHSADEPTRPDKAVATIQSPVGPLLIRRDGSMLSMVRFAGDGVTRPPGACAPIDSARATSPTDELLVETASQLDAYFAGRRREFDLPLAAVGSEFQQRVWAWLRTIPFGRTTSYADVAAGLGLPPGASRAVGLANGANPIAIIVPCHRVIGSDGTLVGYAGGLSRKRFLLDLESPSVQERLFEG